MRRFEFVEGSSNKFWEVSTEGAVLLTRFGRIGAAGQTTQKNFASEAAAKQAADKLVTQKTSKGYVEVRGAKPAPAKQAKKTSVTSPPTSDRAAIENALVKARLLDAKAAARVHADDLAILGEVLASSELRNGELLVDKQGHVTDFSAMVGLSRRLGGPLAKLPKLTSIELSGARVNQVPKGFFGSPTLESLIIEHCLPAFPDEVGAAVNLKVLSFTQCNAKALPKTLKPLPKLEELWLTENKLTEVPDWVAKCPKLQNLDLSENPIPALPAGLEKLPLKRLAVHSAKLTSFPAALTNCKTLEILNLMVNKLGEVPESIGQLKALKELYVSDVKISKLPAAISTMIKLEVLTASQNLLTELPDLSKLTKLKKLSVKSNKLTSIDPRLKGRVAELFIDDNPLAGAKQVTPAQLEAGIEDDPYPTYKKALVAFERTTDAVARAAFKDVALRSLEVISSDMDEHGDANADEYGDKPQSFFTKELKRVKALK